VRISNQAGGKRSPFVCHLLQQRFGHKYGRLCDAKFHFRTASIIEKLPE
jgi:hypothetical protein